MVIAELKGKLTGSLEFKEDILTSNVFSFFNYSSRNIFLGSFLELIGVNDVDKLHLEEAEFIFWPVYSDKTEPDVVILVGDYYLLFETKYTSGFGQATKNNSHQLEREFMQGILVARSMGREFRLFAVTNDVLFTQDKYQDIPVYLRGEVHFLNWQGITRLIERILESSSGLSNGDYLMASDLHELLLKKNLRSYQGAVAFDGIRRIESFNTELFYISSTSRFSDLFLGFDKRLGEQSKVLKPSKIFLENENE